MLLWPFLASSPPHPRSQSHLYTATLSAPYAPTNRSVDIGRGSELVMREGMKSPSSQRCPNHFPHWRFDRALPGISAPQTGQSSQGGAGSGTGPWLSLPASPANAHGPFLFSWGQSRAPGYPLSSMSVAPRREKPKPEPVEKGLSRTWEGRELSPSLWPRNTCTWPRPLGPP